MSTVSQQPTEERERKIREASYLPFPGRVQNKNKDYPRLVFISPPQAATAGGGEERACEQKESRLAWQVEAPKHPRNKFCCLARGAQSARCWSPGAGIGGAPGKTLKTPVSAGVQHRTARLGKEVKVPQKKQQNPRQQRSLVKPEFLLQHPSLCLSGWLQKQHTPPQAGSELAGGGARAVPRVWRSPRAPGAPPARRGRRSHDSTTARLPFLSGPPTPKLRGTNGNHFRSTWLSPSEEKS